MDGDPAEQDPEQAPGPRPARRPAGRPLNPGDETFRPRADGGRPGDRPAPGGAGRGASASKRPRRDPDEPREETSPGPSWVERIVFGSVGSGHLARFCGQFATYQDAGVDLLRSLASLRKQFARTALGPVLGRLETATRGGDSLADAMGREPHAFDRLCLAMIRVAETRGGIPETLRLLAHHYEARQRMIRQARSALIYPTIVLGIASAVALLMAIFVLPKFGEMLTDLARSKNISLPFPSRVLLGFSDFITSVGWWLLPVLFVGGIVGALAWYRTPAGRQMLDSLSMYVPVLGLIRRKIETGRFARTLGALLHAGVDINSSLKLTGGVLAIPSFRRAVAGTRSLVMEGTDLADALARSRRFDPDVVAIVESGEESGRMPEALDKLASSYEEQVETLVKNLGQLLQPVLIIGVGGVVVFVILAVVLPYIQVITSLMGG